MKSKKSKEVYLIAGFPKTGNTQLNQALIEAAKNINNSWDETKLSCSIHQIYRKSILGLNIPKLPKNNPFFGNNKIQVFSHWKGNCWWMNKDLFYLSKISKAIIINRNPYDTLLSTINTLGDAIRFYGLKKMYRNTIKLLLPDYYHSNYIKNYKENFNLDFLKENRFLNQSLINFADHNTYLPLFNRYSGKWSKFSESYDNCKFPVLKISYEEVYESNILNDFEDISKKLSNFLETDYKILQLGFHNQNQKALMKNKENNFSNKMKPYYFREYFSNSAIKYFYSKYQALLQKIGYEGLI